jgi:hypothetical protein
MNPQNDEEKKLKDLASTMLDISRESVALVKRSDQKQSLKLSRSQEWDIYMEFLKVLFNFADRLSAFYIPIQGQPEFMNSLEDAVSERLKVVLAPSMTSAEIDDMEIILSVGTAVSESRTLYDPFKFVVTEESKAKDALLQVLSGQVAAKAGAPTNSNIKAAADLCARAVIPAMTALFQGATPEPSAEASSATAPSAEAPPPVAEASEMSPSPEAPEAPNGSTRPSIKLVSVISQTSGEEIETRWGVPPRFQRDLKKDEANQLAEYMNRVTRILGERFSKISASLDVEPPSSPASPPSGQA